MSATTTSAQKGTPMTAQARRTPLDALKKLLLTPTIGPLIALIAACLFFSTQNERFLTGGNFSLLVQQIVVVATLAIGQTLIILTAGIDLSNGMIMAFGGVLMAKLATANGIDPTIAMGIGLAVTTSFGFINGLLVTSLRLPPFIVTLGTLNIVFALTRLYTTASIPNLTMPLTIMGNTFNIGETRITYGTVFMFVLYFLTWFMLTQTAIGRHIYAVGDNPEAARLTGIPVNRILLFVYAMAGLFYGLGSLQQLGRTPIADPQAGQTDNLASITAVVLGGTSLFGGRGNILGTLIGALIVSVFRNGLQLMGQPALSQVLITGVLVILAVALDQWSQRGKA